MAIRTAIRKGRSRSFPPARLCWERTKTPEKLRSYAATVTGAIFRCQKGKLKKDETIEACAIREVEEEIGQHLVIQSYAGLTHYLAAGVPKVVFYFIMCADRADCAPKDSGEIVDVIWKKPDEGIDMLTYPGDRQLLRQLAKSGVIQG